MARSTACTRAPARTASPRVTEPPIWPSSCATERAPFPGARSATRTSWRASSSAATWCRWPAASSAFATSSRWICARSRPPRPTPPSSCRWPTATSRSSTGSSSTSPARSTTPTSPACSARSSATRASAPSCGARPARGAGHHAYLGGLLEHTVAVTTLAQESALLHPRLNSDLLLCAAILHDIGKTLEFDLGAEIQLSEAGALVGHVALGQQLVAERARTLDGFPDTKLHAISHCILAHHGAESLPGAPFPLGGGARAVPAKCAGCRGKGRPGARALARFRAASATGQTHVLDGWIGGCAEASRSRWHTGCPRSR